jgi:PhoPQ-activated pathogenicity-related protein
MVRFLAGLALAASVSNVAPSLLSDYVEKPDSSYSWRNTGVVSEQPDYTAYLLNMTSQTWLQANQSNRQVWTHQLMVFVPHSLGPAASSTASLYVTGNKNIGGDIDEKIDITSEDVKIPSGLAVSTQSVWATLFQVPNQPIVFGDDPLNISRGEDSIIPFTWNLFMDKTPGYGPDVNVFFPMVKAAIRAMDTITDFTSHNLTLHGAQEPRPFKATSNFSIDKFVLTGASKRAWTAWLAAAVDGVTKSSPTGASRVIGLAPIVMDALNLEQGMRMWWRAYGGWSFAMHDFWEQNITTRIGTPAFAALMATVDPLAYAERLTMPKLVIDATGDEFFYLQDDSVWWNQDPLPGESHRLMVANAEHSFATGIPTLKPALDSFVASLLDEVQAKEPAKEQPKEQEQGKTRFRPNVSWHFSGTDNNTITVISTDKPLTVELFHAHTTPLTGERTTVQGTRVPPRRDFRMVVGDTPDDPCKTVKIPGFGDGCLNPIVWEKQALTNESMSEDQESTPFVYTGKVDKPLTGWKAFFVQLTFPYPLAVASPAFQTDQRKHIVSTQVGVVPQTYPFTDCTEDGSGCKGGIV